MLLTWEGGTCAIKGEPGLQHACLPMWLRILQNHESASPEEFRHDLVSIGKHDKEEHIEQQLRRPESGVVPLRSVKR
jgi:hypothetical protein